MGEGDLLVEIGEYLNVSSKTIGRDVHDLREAHAVRRDPKFVEEMVGDLVHQAEQSVRRIQRARRTGGLEPMEEISAEIECWRIRQQLVETLQKLGYLPTAALEVRSDITHTVALDVPSYQQLQEELVRVEKIQATSGQDEEAVMRLRSIRTKVERLAVSEEIQHLSDTSYEEKPHDRK